MDAHRLPPERFEAGRIRLRAVAYQLLGSLTDADDAVQEGWLRASAADISQVGNLDGWLTTIVARISLNMLRARRSRREEPLLPHLPDPVISAPDALTPEDEALLVDEVGLALLILLDTLAPAERVAFVLHDLFAMPYDEIARIADRSLAATRKLASRARTRVR